MEKQVAECMESLGLVRRNDGLGWYKEFDHEPTIDFPNHIATFFYTELKKREDELRSRHITDLAQAVGILQGLGHPNDLLERHYQEAVSQLKQKE